MKAILKVQETQKQMTLESAKNSTDNNSTSADSDSNDEKKSNKEAKSDQKDAEKKTDGQLIKKEDENEEPEVNWQTFIKAIRYLGGWHYAIILCSIQVFLNFTH